MEDRIGEYRIKLRCKRQAASIHPLERQIRVVGVCLLDHLLGAVHADYLCAHLGDASSQMARTAAQIQYPLACFRRQ
jgi:hypothetical protein